MAEALSDRQFESYRRTNPGRVVTNRKDTGLHSEEYALAVVGADGGSVTVNAEGALYTLLAETQRQNRLLALILQQLGGFYLEDGLSTG